LPLIASQQLGLDTDCYGLLFAALGVGAVIAALCLGWVKQHLSSNGVPGLAAISFALAFGSVVVVPSPWVAFPLLVVCGFGWTATRWRAPSCTCPAGYAPAPSRSTSWCFWVRRRSPPDLGTHHPTPGLRVAVLAAATVALEPEPEAGPILVSIEYEVAADQEADFLSAMESMRRSQLRSGASRWDPYRVGESPGLFLEQFQVPTWREHQRQHDGRVTAEDQAIEDAAFAHIVGAPRAQHLLPPGIPRDSLVPHPQESG
jgi:hypothetical protein